MNKNKDILIDVMTIVPYNKFNKNVIFTIHPSAIAQSVFKSSSVDFLPVISTISFRISPNNSTYYASL